MLKKFDVTSLSLSRPQKKRKLKIRYIYSDISKKKLFKILKDDYDYVINFGGHVNHNEKVKTYNTHYKGTKYLADFFKKVKFALLFKLAAVLNMEKSNLHKKKVK